MDVFARRRAGILLHPTSLPGPEGNGDLGADAYRFVDFLCSCGVSLWQTLPLGPTHEDLSPYQCLSVHAGNFRLISLQSLEELGWLYEAKLDEALDLDTQRKVHLLAAYEGFQRQAGEDDRGALAHFVQEHSRWLDDFALYESLRAEHGGKAWYLWPQPIRDRAPRAMEAARKRLAKRIE